MMFVTSRLAFNSEQTSTLNFEFQIFYSNMYHNSYTPMFFLILKQCLTFVNESNNLINFIFIFANFMLAKVLFTHDKFFVDEK